jgi:hypothetical protein
MKIKVLIFSDYGSEIPPVLEERMNGKTFKENRCGDIIDFIENTAVHFDFKGTTQLLNLLEKHPILFFGEQGGKDKQLFLAKGGYFKSPYAITFTVQEIDTEKEYILEEYDGAEYLREKTFVKVDDELPIFKGARE